MPDHPVGCGPTCLHWRVYVHGGAGLENQLVIDCCRSIRSLMSIRVNRVNPTDYCELRLGDTDSRELIIGDLFLLLSLHKTVNG